jgi:NAD(P)-dependent dehydrogenase (short-subunit alcohol dehydrogenase family)
MFSLEGKRAIVNGGTGGHGAAIADGFAAFGASVAVLGTEAEAGVGAAVVDCIVRTGREAFFLEVDVTDPQHTDRVVQDVVDRFGGLDILVNTEEAGIFRVGQCQDVTDADWDEMISINLTGVFNMCRSGGRVMIAQGGGTIINFSTTDAFLGVPNQVAYCASKGGVTQLTRVLAVDWIQHGVRVNAIAPCDFATPLVEPFLQDPEYRDWIMSAIPIGRVGQTPEIVGAAVYLASDASSMVVGHTLLVDGGRTVI